MHQFLLIIVLLMTGWGPSQKTSPAPVKGEGITGWVYQETGNRMPMKGAAPQKPTGLSVTVCVYKLTNLDQTSRVGITPFYSAIHTKPVGAVHSDSTGAFTIRLAPGVYSLFVRLGDRFYANSFDGHNNIAPVTVKKGKLTPVTIIVNPDAVY